MGTTPTTKEKAEKRIRRHARVRARVVGTALRPRLSVYRSNRYLHAQLIDDERGVSLGGVFSKGDHGKNKMDNASRAGKRIAALAKERNVGNVVFDRGGFGYAGRIKAFAEGAREGGLKF